MDTFIAEAWLPSWLMVLFGIAAVVIPLYVSFYKQHRANAYKVRSFALSWLFLLALFAGQTLQLPLMQNQEVNKFLGRLGIAAVLWSGIVLCANGTSNDILTRLLYLLLHRNRSGR